MTLTAVAEPRAGMRLSAAAFMDLPDAADKRKMELDDGELYIMPRPRPGHQFSRRESWLRALYLPKLYFADLSPNRPRKSHHDIILSLFPERPRLLLSPDLIVIRRGGPAIVTSTMVVGVPDIIVEILSADRARDLVRKRQLYAAAGVPEYWLFDLRSDTVDRLEPDNGAYSRRARLTAGDTLTTPRLPGLRHPAVRYFPAPQPPAPGRVAGHYPRFQQCPRPPAAY